MDYQTAAEKLAAGAAADGAAAFCRRPPDLRQRAQVQLLGQEPVPRRRDGAGTALEKMLDVAFGTARRAAGAAAGRARGEGSSVEVEVEEEGGAIVWKAEE